MMEFKVYIGLAQPNTGNIAAVNDAMRHTIGFADPSFGIPVNSGIRTVIENTMIYFQSVAVGQNRDVG